MNFSKSLLLVISLFFAGALFVACGNQKSHSHEVEMTGPEYTSDYVCPMHCEGSGSDSPGTCPVCGMQYVPLDEHQEDGHMHMDESHEHHGHEDHGDHDH